MREDAMTEAGEGVTWGREPGVGVPPEGGKSQEADHPLGPLNGTQRCRPVALGPVRALWMADSQSCRVRWALP